jgi:hypothetical protein
MVVHSALPPALTSEAAVVLAVEGSTSMVIRSSLTYGSGEQEQGGSWRPIDR